MEGSMRALVAELNAAFLKQQVVSDRWTYVTVDPATAAELLATFGTLIEWRHTPGKDVEIRWRRSELPSNRD